MKITSTFRAVLLAVSLSVIGGVAAARSSEMVQPGRQDIVAVDQAPMTVAAVRKAIIDGGAHHEWKAIGDKPGVLTLEASSGEHRVFVDVAYDAKSFQIAYKDSANMNFQQSGTKVTIHPKYNKWIEDLSTSIRNAAIDAQAIRK
jgi:hypothetical protein